MKYILSTFYTHPHILGITPSFFINTIPSRHQISKHPFCSTIYTLNLYIHKDDKSGVQV